MPALSSHTAAYDQLEKVRHEHDLRFDIQILGIGVHVSGVICSGPISLLLYRRRGLVSPFRLVVMSGGARAEEVE